MCCIWDKSQTNYGFINPSKNYHKNHVVEQHTEQYMGHALWTTEPSHLNVVWRKKSEGSEGRKAFHRQMSITFYQIEWMWLQVLATEGGMIAPSKRSCPGINKQRHSEENTNTHPHGVLGVWRLHCVRSRRYMPSTKELKPDCSDNTARHLSAMACLPDITSLLTHTLMLFYPAECVCVCVCVCVRKWADTEYLFICMQAHELSVSGEEDKGFFLSTMWVTERTREERCISGLA